MAKKIARILVGMIFGMTLAATSFAAEFTYTDDASATATMNQIVQRLTNASGLDVPIRIVIEHYNDVNAFSSASGTLIVTQGLLRSVSTEEELAGAIAHEMGHMIPADQRRGVRSISGFGGDEFGADKRGVQILEMAGYNPVCLAQMLEIVLKNGSHQFPITQVWQLKDRIHRVEKSARHYVPSVTPVSAEAIAGM